MSRYDHFPHEFPSQLVGRILQSAVMGCSRPDEEDPRPDSLTFITDAGAVIWDVEGDCCSDSRFTDLKLDALLGKRIATVEQIEAMVDPALDPATLRKFVYPGYDENYDDRQLPAGVERAPQEEEQIYGVRLTADDGAVGFVVHRNWSNGYYGGMLSERDPQV